MKPTSAPNRGAHDRAPLFREAFALAEWVQGRLSRNPTLALLARRLRPSDHATLTLIGTLLEANGRIYAEPAVRDVLGLVQDPLPPDCGLGLGSYLSQWCGAVYLDGLDHFVTRELRPGDYLRYMDDFVLLGDNRSELEEARAAVETWLRQERGLELDPKRRHVVPTKEACVYLGYRVSPSGVSPSRKLRRRFEANVRAAAERGEEELERTLAAYRGLLTF